MQNRAVDGQPGPLWQDAEGWHLGDAVRGVSDDSRTVKPGEIFVAVVGRHADGHRHIGEAVARGAIAVVGEQLIAPALPVPYLRVESSREALAQLAAAFYRFPARSLTVVGVTGTNGKTTVSHWIRQILETAGHPTGLLSSIVADTGREREAATLTTPPAPALQRYLAAMRDHGRTHAVLEVSSHALCQHRVTGVRFRVAVLTNITREHLDYHGTMEAYAAAKARLFTELSEVAVINGDDSYGRRWLRRGLPIPALAYGLEGGAVRGEIVEQGAWGSVLRIRGMGAPLTVRLPHPGRHNAYNALAAAAAAWQLGVPRDRIAGALENLAAVPGRLEVVDRVDGVTVMIDYAHTPDGLVQALGTARQMTGGRIWLVFGARGDRDRGKRSEMGAIAARLADEVVVTTDSPGSEEPEAIAEAVWEGAREAFGKGAIAAHLHRILDRRRAIQWAVAHAQPGDLVLITGRGPETHILVNGRRQRLVDAELVRQATTMRRLRPGRRAVPTCTGGGSPLS